MMKKVDRIKQHFEQFKSELLICKVWADEYPAKKDYKLSWLEKFVMTVLILIKYVSLDQLKSLIKNKGKHSQSSEIIALFQLIMLALLVFSPCDSSIYLWIVVYLLITVFGYPLYIIFVDAYDEKLILRSPNRSLMLLFINYIAIIMGFAALYIYTDAIGDTCKVPISKPLDAIYFSSVTITTLGYGDFTPMNKVGKILVSVETIVGLIFVVLVVAIFISWKQRTKE